MSAAMRLPQTDWLHHRLTLSGPPGALGAFRTAACGAGLIPWHLDLDQAEEDWFLRLVAPSAPQPERLSLAGARILAAKLRAAVARRHDIAVSAVGISRACPFDLHSLLPVPADILRLGPEDPRALSWLWTHWGTTEALRQVAEITPARERQAGGLMVLSFWAADWTPWRAFATLKDSWTALRFEIRPDYGTP
jgi:hypothetical protein